MSKQDGAKRLPSDCWLMIFSLLSNADLKAVSLSCKAFLEHSNSLKKSLKVVHPEMSMLSQHLKRSGQLKNIDVSDFEGDEVEAIREIGRCAISLEALDISTFHIHFVELMESLRGLPSNLKALNCRIRTYRDDGDDDDVVDVDVEVDMVANTFPDLEQLKIEAPDELIFPIPIGIGFESLASKLKLLKKIHLFACKVGDQFIIALSLNCVLLKDVAIDDPHYVTETGVGHLLRNRPNLEALSFDALPKPEYSSSINIENSISHNKALTSLMLCWMSDTDKVLKAIAKAKLGLNNLTLKYCKDLSASGLLAVLSNHQLTKLSMLGPNHITDEDMKLLVLNGNVSNLTYFEIRGGQVTSSTLFLLSTRCPSLVDIRMTISVVYEQVELDIPLSKNHKIVNLSHCRINDEFSKQFGLLFPNLKVLHLSSSYSKDTCTGIEAFLKSCKKIAELNLRGYDIANDPELLELNLEVLTLSVSNIDDEGLAAIAKKCPRLLSLDLSYCWYITTEGIKQVVQNVKTLTTLNLMYCDCRKNYGALLEWMLSTGNLASLNKIFLHKRNFTKEQRDKFLHHGCLLSSV